MLFRVRSRVWLSRRACCSACVLVSGFLGSYLWCVHVLERRLCLFAPGRLISHAPFSVRLRWCLVLVWFGGRSGVCPEVHVTLEPVASEEMSAGRPGTFMVALAWRCVCVPCAVLRYVKYSLSLLTGPAKQKNQADDTSQTAQRNDHGRWISTCYAECTATSWFFTAWQVSLQSGTARKRCQQSFALFRAAPRM